MTNPPTNYPPPPSYPPEMPGYPPQAPPYAAWIKRVGAYLIDGIIVSVPSWIGTAINTAMSTDGKANAAGLVISLLLSLVSLGLTIYNRWYLAGTTGQSWGKKLLNIRLVGAETGQPIGGLMAFVRDLAHLIDALICFIGYLFPLWTAKKQTIADMLVSSVVVDA
jgi:uncharacterized RDD family membrane protein YckC